MAKKNDKGRIDMAALQTAPKKLGHPSTRTMPEQIDATPEEIAEVVLRAKPKKSWRFEEEANKKPR